MKQVNGIILGPGVHSYYNQIIIQTYEPIQSFGDEFNRLRIDRQDWTTCFSYTTYDNYSLCPGNIEGQGNVPKHSNYIIKL